MHGYRVAGHDRSAPELTHCDREPIHVPGTIQPHGVLIALTADTWQVCAISENVSRYQGAAAADLLGRPVSELIDAASLAALRGIETKTNGEVRRLTRAVLFGRPDMGWRVALHRNEAGLLLEAEARVPGEEVSALDYFDRFHIAILRLQRACDVAGICQGLAAEIRQLTGHDRVMVYRFATDWSGEVIAEDRNTSLPSYLGLRFPASDIPVQARALYASNLERQIPDVGYRPVPVLAVPALATGDVSALDLSQVGLRSVSPLHIAYLQNMGVGASMSVSILHEGRLWGLVACHHHASHDVCAEWRQASTLLGQLAAVRLNLVEQAQLARRSIALKAVETSLLDKVADGHDYCAALLQNSRLMLDLLDATGVALISGGKVTTLGETPDRPALDPLLTWLSVGGSDLVAFDHLAAVYPPAAAWPAAAGILSVPLGGVAQNRLVWFRPEQARTVRWAGDPHKAGEAIAGTTLPSPRRSFETWTQDVRGQSKPWSSEDIATAAGLRDIVVDIIVRHTQRLEQMNSQLSRSNADLEAFASFAAHDLKEPLRQIETFGTLIRRAYDGRAESPEKIDRWFNGIHNSARRLRLLISDLAEYARLGHQVRAFEPVVLDDLLRAVLQDFDTRIEQLGAQIEVSPLPVLMGDAMQLRQVLQNLIANGLKYRHAERAPRLRISAGAPIAPPAHRAGGWPYVTIRVEDNGIGFDERHREQIFEPFERLHSGDTYEGTGLGLAICRAVVNRHGGTISAHGQPGEGAVFLLTLPLRPPAPAVTQTQRPPP